jgi:hypothetical protein
MSGLSCGIARVGWAKARLRAVPTRNAEQVMVGSLSLSPPYEATTLRIVSDHSPNEPVKSCASPPQSSGRSPRFTY